MSEGKDHDKFNSYVYTGIFAAGIVSLETTVLLAAVGCAVGTVWLSPDLDLPHSLPTQRLGALKHLFRPYRDWCGKHRSPLSHSPIFSSLFRVLYCGWPFLLIAASNPTYLNLLLDWHFIAFLIGLEISTDLHLILDWQYSLKRKLLK